MSEIQDLTERVRVLSESTDWWNDKMIWALVLAAVAAVLVVLTTVMALRRAGQTSGAQSELIQAKDRQLAVDLSEKEGKIAEAQKAAGEANERAAKLLAFIQPRELTLDQQRTIGKALTEFEGRKVTVKSLSWDPDGYALAKQIIAALKHGGLDISDQSGLDSLYGSIALRGVRLEASASELIVAERIAVLLRTTGKLKEVTVKELHPSIVLPTGTVPDPRAILDIYVEAKPFEVLK